MQKTQPNDETLIQKLDQACTQLDETRADVLAQVKLKQTIKTQSQVRELKRLAKKEGVKSPRLQKMAAQLQFNRERIKVLEEESAKTGIPTPTVNEDSWLVQGRILTPGRQGVKGLTIGLGDAKGQWVQELGYTTTNEQGYFKIQYVFTKKDQEKIRSLDRLDAEALRQAGVTHLQTVYVLVSDRTQRVLVQDSEPLEIEPGMIDYREIILTDNEAGVPPKGGKAETLVDPKEWKVIGQVVDENGQGIKNMVVSVYDKDLIFDDKLGDTQTNENGEFEFKYRTDKFRDVVEANPDLYLKVMDKQGSVMHTTKKAIRFEAGQVENFNIQLKASGAYAPESQPNSSGEKKSGNEDRPGQEKKKKPK